MGSRGLNILRLLNAPSNCFAKGLYQFTLLPWGVGVSFSTTCQQNVWYAKHSFPVPFLVASPLFCKLLEGSLKTLYIGKKSMITF